MGFMTAGSAQQGPYYGAVKGWLIVVAALIAVMVLVGGATRLTESGLSIVEWKPVTGTLPPLNEAQWLQAFEGYKAIPQYRELNAGMSLHEFKTIFWWEWSHRLLGRVIGAVYLLPFLFFLWRGALECRAEEAAVGDLCARRAAGRGRLVDGRVGPDASHRGVAISAGDASHIGADHLCLDRLDVAADECASAACRSRAAEVLRASPCSA